VDYQDGENAQEEVEAEALEANECVMGVEDTL
jgi:hypothetical protein